MTTPRMVTVPCSVRRAPRIRAGEHSPWYTGAVDEFMPLPIPVAMRPTISCATVYDDARIAAPTIMIRPPEISIVRRPSRSPTK